MTPDNICGDCDAEGFIVCNLLLAFRGHCDLANTTTTPLSVLKVEAKAFMESSIRMPVEHFHGAFAASTYADDRTINGTEVQAWKFLSQQRNFSQLRTWVPQEKTRAGKSDFYLSLRRQVS
jgi:hypothetical protein